jgi:hypothetical protein
MNMTNRASQILFAAILVLCAAFAHSQVSVAIAPDPHPQFLSSSGAPLAGGFLYTYAAGTTTNLNTYVDSTGTTQNPDPIPLDSTGAPSNGSVQTGIWLANTAYKFCAYNSALVQQWCTDNVTGYLGLLNTANLWTFQQTFSLPIVDTQTDNQEVFGSVGNQTTLDFPPPTGNVTLHMPNTSDTMVGRNTVDTLANKTLTTPTVNGAQIVNTPGTYVVIPNATPTGTVPYSLVILGGTSATNATVALTSTSSGVQGICVATCDNTGSAIVQQSGQAPCVFDGPTTFNDAVVPSIITGGDCHDAGFAASANTIATVQSTNGAAGTYSVLLNAASGGAAGLLCSDGTTTTVAANVTTQQILKTCQIAAGRLNVVGKTFRLNASVGFSPQGSSPTSELYFGFGTSSALGTYTALASQASSTSFWYDNLQWLCVTTLTGTSGQLSCEQLSTLATSGGSPAIVFSGIAVTLTANLTVPLYVGMSCTFSSGSTSNSCYQVMETVEQLN